MNRNDTDYTNFIKILEEELPPAMGCTEPIAVIYCMIMAGKTLGVAPGRIVVEASDNTIKDVESVIVPNTGHLRGILAATAVSIVVGNIGRQLEVVASVAKEEQESTRVFMEQVPITVNIAPSPLIFDIAVTVYISESYAKVHIANYHTNIVLVEKDGEVLQPSEAKDDNEPDMTDRSCLSAEKIYDLANAVDVEDVRKLLDVRIAYNMDISEEGLKNDCGANIGSVLLKANKEVTDSCNESALRLKARVTAVAGSNARMNGRELPVIISSGSENQSITASMLVIVYAGAMDVGEEKLYHALVLSNLLGIYQKIPVGRLNAYYGAVSAGAAAGCGIAYLKGVDLDRVIHILINAPTIVSDVVCDGAKASYAGKITLAADNGILGCEMYQEGRQSAGGDGIVRKGVENIIASVERLGHDGMAGTDKEVLRVMVSD